MITFNKKKIIAFFISFNLILFLFQYNLISINSVFGYTDELFTIIIVLCYFYKIIKFGMKKEDMIYLSLLFIILLFGITGNFISNVNNRVYIIFLDSLSVFKVLVTYISIKNIVDMSIVNCIDKYLSLIFLTFIHCALIFLPLGYILNLTPLFGEARYGIRSYQFICENPGLFGYYVSSILAFLALKTDLNQKSYKRYLFECILLMLNSIKGPAVIFCATIVFMKFISLKKIKLYHIILISLMIVLLGTYQLNEYILNNTSARYYLNITGFKIANTYFPFGSGFGTFGSNISRIYYSKIYYKYGLSSIWGLGPTSSSLKGAYITDNYWPMIIGQFGYIVCIIFIYLYLCLFKKLNAIRDIFKARKYVFLSLYIMYMVGSFGSQYLTSVNGIFSFSIIGMYVAVMNNKKVLRK